MVNFIVKLLMEVKVTLGSCRCKIFDIFKYFHYHEQIFNLFGSFTFDLVCNSTPDDAIMTSLQFPTST